MTARTDHCGAAFSDLVDQNLAGQKAANNYLNDVRTGVSTHDALFDRVRLIASTGENERLRSFCRVIAKALERA